MSRYQKDPDAILDWRFDWSSWLTNGETIVTSAVLVSTGITATGASAGASSVDVWLSGGTAGRKYSVTNRVTTSAGRTDDRTITISVVQR